MRLAKAEREKAMACAVAVRNGERAEPFRGPAHVHYEIRRVRLLDTVNAWGSLKHLEDGVVAIFLPHGDGPTAPYRFTMSQTPVPRGAEGLLVTITEE